MTPSREDISRMARDAGIMVPALDYWTNELEHLVLERFFQAAYAAGAAAERKSKPHSLGPGEMELSLRREHDGELFELRHRFTAEQVFHGNDYMVEQAAQAMDEMLDERIAAAIRARGQA